MKRCGNAGMALVGGWGRGLLEVRDLVIFEGGGLKKTQKYVLERFGFARPLRQRGVLFFVYFCLFFVGFKIFLFFLYFL